MRRAALFVLLAAACAAAQSADPHDEPVVAEASPKNIALVNHAEKSIDCAKVLALLQAQYDFLSEYVGAGPERIAVHLGAKYACGFSIPSAPAPEMFLQAPRIFDTTHDYAHEMMHCFLFRYGALPHWFNESMSDVAYVDSEIELYRRQEEAPFLASFDRVDHRSFELLRLRARFGREFFRKVCREMEARREKCVAVFTPGGALEEKNRLLLAILTQAAGEDLTPLFSKEWGFNPRTRERQRGY